MASLFTAPRSRPVMYEKNPIIASDVSKEDTRSAGMKKLTSAINKGVRVLADQIPVVKTLTGLQTTLGLNNKFIFSGVQSIKWQLARDITEQYGLQSFTILPWYTKAVSITVTGKVYLGAFATDITAANRIVNTSLQSKGVIEYIREEMRELDTLLNSAGFLARSATTLPSALSVGVDGEPGSIRVLGFVKSFDVEENVDTPYVQRYTLTYLGVDAEWYSASRANNRAVLDAQPQKSQRDKIISPNQPKA